MLVKKVLFIFDDFEKILDNKFALAAFTLVSDLLQCEEYNAHLCITSTNNVSSYFSSFLKREKKKIERNKVKFKGIDINTPEMSLECCKLNDYECGVVITKHLDRKLFYTEMMTEEVRRMIDKKEHLIQDFQPIDWMIMLSKRPAVINAEGKPGALISLARQLQNQEMDVLDRDLEEGDDSNSYSGGANGYIGDRDDDSMSERSILEGLEKWIRETTHLVHSKMRGSNSTKKVVIDPRCISLWARIAINAKKMSKEAVLKHTVKWEVFVSALESVIKRWTKVENVASRQLSSDERAFLKNRMDHCRHRRTKDKSAPVAFEVCCEPRTKNEERSDECYFIVTLRSSSLVRLAIIVLVAN